MSKIALSGNASGTGTLTIAAPNTNSNYTLTIPGETGTLLTTTGDGSGLTGIVAGITEVDQWRQTANTTITGATDITSNWERVDSVGFGKLGTGMSESSGVFTFPSTGYWLVTFNFSIYKNGAIRNAEGWIKYTSDNSTYTTVSRTNLHTLQAESSNTHASSVGIYLFDITDTANQKVKFAASTDTTSYSIFADTTTNVTYSTFIRLGDT